jgi:hypothetical protein
MRPQYFLSALALAGCASAETREQGVTVDSGTGGTTEDSGSGVPADAATSTPPDSGPPPCTMMTRDLLTNGPFEAGGTGWSVVPIIANDPLVGDGSEGGIAAHTPTMRAWMGGVAQANATDRLYQDVMVPASTTALVLTGFYEVRSSESGSTVYDTGKAEITTTTGTSLELVKAFDNAHKTTAWTSLDYTVTNLAAMTGQTVRVHFTTTNDGLNSTSFYFDSLHLNATVCE